MKIESLTLIHIFANISLNNGPFFKIQKLACSGKRACRQENHNCRQKIMPVVTGDDMTTKQKH